MFLELVEGSEEAGAGPGHAHRPGNVPLTDDHCGFRRRRRRGRGGRWWCASRSPSLVVLTLIVFIVRRASGSTAAGVVATGLYAATYRVSGAWADTARVDSLLLALLLAAVLVGMRVRTW